MSDDFTRRRLTWLHRVVRDTRLTPFDCRVATILALGYLSREVYGAKGVLEAWPSQRTLASDAVGSIDGVRRTTRKLEKAGHLKVSVGGGRRFSSRYTLVEPPQDARRTTDKPPPSGPVVPDAKRRKPPTPRGKNPLNKPFEEPSPPAAAISRLATAGGPKPRLHSPVRIGDRVTHRQHGRGRVAEVHVDERHPTAPYVTVSFDEVGDRRVLATVLTVERRGRPAGGQGQA